MISDSDVKNVLKDDGVPGDSLKTFHQYENTTTVNLKTLRDELNNYKDAFQLKDFTDMIEKFIMAELCPKFDVVFIDEAQDLSPIQWKMLEIIKNNTKHMILAGDDDQAIYAWAGADVKRFINCLLYTSPSPRD